ncbi:SPX-domain-containing protein [Annulohypoxylon maeteangense]|uniref:SPX-domain-containing protein n=1 Tax=Annulohypoxylon maeteangense TaxID=1927788 RepID=UPI002008B00D|nr:SPX-domain-containing protein [Annulohypoxylon maeteangense]KAI0882415.1 SPX-domain-containing protein [Annulohypoxylon maeteangense]
MRFGKTLRESIYPPWKDQYIDYSKLKTMLREDRREDEDVPWTEDDENKFCDEIFNVQLEKVAQFQEKIVASLKERAEVAFEKLKDMAPSTDDKEKPKSDITTARLKELKSELDSVTNEVKELKKYSSANYTGFLKIAKKHDRKRGDRYKVRPMMRVSLSERGFNSEQAYSPLLTKLSLMYYAINQNLDESEQRQPLDLDLENPQEVHNGERYTAHKFWIHSDNLLEVKTAILRHLPSLVYTQQAGKEPDGNNDPKITSVYFDNSKFEIYGIKVDRQVDASSLRLRWYGQLDSRPDIVLEQKIVHENGISEEKKFHIKDKYIKQFIDGDYKMEKTVHKMERQGQTAEAIESFKTTAGEIQDFIIKGKLEPILRANYTRTAFQKPSDDRVRISIDTDIAFIREDTLDRDRPCRDPQEWHRIDIDNGNMSYPFKNINQSEVSRFPYALLEIKLKEEGGRKRPRWIEDLMVSHLVHAAPRFSKFVHGVASLFEDYVNHLPLWLSDLETDIRKDPQTAHDEEEQRKAQQAEDAMVVGSFLGGGAAAAAAKMGSYKPATSSPVGKSYLSERAARDARDARASLPPTAVNQDVEPGDEEGATQQRGYGTLSSVFPGFSLTRYSRAKRQRAQLPEGVTKPEVWLKNAGPLQVEPKVWLANERTFLKWQHICILLGSLAISLYTAAGENFVAECMGIAYVIIAVMAGTWGYVMLHKRRDMIMERSGKDFDNMIGPLAVSAALMFALILNFVISYRAAFAKFDKPLLNETEAMFPIGELL